MSTLKSISSSTLSKIIRTELPNLKQFSIHGKNRFMSEETLKLVLASVREKQYLEDAFAFLSEGKGRAAVSYNLAYATRVNGFRLEVENTPDPYLGYVASLYCSGSRGHESRQLALKNVEVELEDQ